MIFRPSEPRATGPVAIPDSRPLPAACEAVRNAAQEFLAESEQVGKRPLPRPILLHVLDCNACGAALTAEFRLQALPKRRTDPEAYEFPVRKAFRKALQTAAGIEQARAEAEAELDTLSFATETTPFQKLARAEAFLAEAIRGRRDDPASAVIPATIAALLADTLEREVFPAGYLADRQAAMWTEKGNLHRIAGELDRAESAFRVALERWDGGTRDQALLRNLGSFYSSWLDSSRQLSETIEFLARLISAFIAAGDTHGAGKLRTQLALMAYRSNGLEASALHAVKALEELDLAAEPALTMAAIHFLLGVLYELDAFDAALEQLERARPMYEEWGGFIDRLKARWLEGKIACARGQLAEAEVALGEVRSEFRTYALPYQEALVSLDLCGVHLQRGAWAAAQELVQEAHATFVRVGIEREALAAVLLLREALVGQVATLALVRRAVAAAAG